MKILLVTTGGTISQEDNDGKHVSVGTVANQGFLDYVRANPKNANVSIDVKNLFNIDSTNVTPDHWNAILKLLEAEHYNYDAFCITHGTNTMGMTAAALSFGLKAFGKPVYMTGSQVPFGVEGADANQNFENMIRIARDYHTRMKGVFVVMGSSVMIGTRVKKVSDNDYNAFSSFQQNALASFGSKAVLQFDEARLAANNANYEPRGKIEVFSSYPTHVIASFTDHVGIDPDDIKILVETGGKKGFIMRGVGVGDIHESFIPVLDFLAEKKIPIAVTTQISAGVASMDVNEPGIAAAQHGAIPTYDMNIESMSAKMAYLIGEGIPYGEFKKEMLRNYKGEIDAEKYIRADRESWKDFVK
ncbi:MAG: asparaginase domain-containing protein [Proteobacteria bacterium]|nr:asparaginase domain-containing protein [Pseudomonadota bacterium]